MKNFILKKYSDFKNDTSGGFAIIFVVSALVVLQLVGVALDFNATQSKKQTMQDALDKAVLASLHAETEAEGRAMLEHFFKTNSVDGKIISFSLDKGEHLTKGMAEVTFDFPLSFSRVIGKKVNPIYVKASAEGPNGLTGVRINIVSAKGDYDKDFKLMVNQGGSITEKVNAIYRSDPHEFKVSNSSWIDLGDYEEVYFDFVIWPCKKQACGAQSFKSNDPAHAWRLRADGKANAPGKAVDILKVVKCGSTTRHDWEDGGGGSPDFTYNIDAKCGGPFIGPGRLTR